MRYLGLDLGTRSCGLAITDKNNKLSTPLEPIFFKNNDYGELLNKLKIIINDKSITDVVLGLPKNMDGTLGFASQRSIDFAQMLKQFNVTIHFVDERLSTVEALSILHFTGKTSKNSKKVIDSVSANIILETFLRSLKHE